LTANAKGHTSPAEIQTLETPVEARRRRDRERYRGTRARRQRKTAANYYASHTDEVLQKRRDKYQSTLQFVTDEPDRKLLRSDPRRAIAKDTVTCLECFQIVHGMLNNAHLRVHDLTARNYKTKWGYSLHTALVSEQMAAKLSARRRCDPKILANFGRSALDRYRHKRKSHGGLKSLESRLNASDRKRGVARPDLSKGMTDAELVGRWCLENKNTEQIAVEAGLTQDAVHNRLRRIFGIHPRQRIRFAHGEPVTDAWLDKFLRNFGGIYRSQLARFIGLPGGRLYTISRRRKNLALDLRSADRLIGAERDLLKVLLSDKGKQPNHLRAVVPDLSVKYRVASEFFSRFKASFPQKAEEERRLDELCAEARKEAASGNGEFRARMILSWLPQMLAWLEENHAHLHRKSGALALQFLAKDYGVASRIVQRALSPKYLGRTNLDTLRSLVLMSMQQKTRLLVAKKHGRPPDKETTGRIRATAAFTLLHWRPKEFASYIFRDKHAPESAFHDLRQLMYTHAIRIKAQKGRLSPNKAQAIVDSLCGSSQPLSPNLISSR